MNARILISRLASNLRQPQQKLAHGVGHFAPTLRLAQPKSSFTFHLLHHSAHISTVSPKLYHSGLTLSPPLDALGIRKIPANQVTLHPFLLGAKFQRHADRVTLRKNGVTPPKKPGSEK